MPPFARETWTEVATKMRFYSWKGVSSAEFCYFNFSLITSLSVFFQILKNMTLPRECLVFFFKKKKVDFSSASV